VTAAAVLPGLRIDVAPPPPAEVLPRMDIAVFVGFAATGPAHLPVAIESVAHFAAVFGSDAPLAWDDEAGERLLAHLGAAVRTFFANGGRRCWVIRVARTASLEALWSARQGRAPSGRVAVANRFPVPGVLALRAGDGVAVPAEVRARSVGSWSDSLTVATALSAAGFEIQAWQPIAATPPDARAAFRATVPLQRGDLIELDSDGLRLFAVVDSAVADLDPAHPAMAAQTTLCAAFEPLAPVPMEFAVAVPQGTAAGQWVGRSDPTGIVWVRIDQIDPIRSATEAVRVIGPAWRQITPRQPTLPPTRASLLTLDMRVSDGVGALSKAGIGLTAQHPSDWWQQVADEAFYAADAPDPSQRFPLAVADTEAGDRTPLAWLPLGATPLFGTACGRFPVPGSALDRDGLSSFDAELFLDPDLADLGVETITSQADVIRFHDPDRRDLFGIHAALAIGNAGLFNEASLLAIPDAPHPGWEPKPDPTPRMIPVPPAPEAENANFVDCERTELNAPSLAGPSKPVAPGPFQLQWDEAGPGALYELQESTRSDFATWRTLHTGPENSYDATADRPGTFFYRVVARLGAASAVSNVVAVPVRDDDWVANKPAQFTPLAENELLRVHAAALRLSAATGEMFATFSLPQHYRAAETARYAARLRAQIGFGEARALSYAAIYHPWAVVGSDRRASPPDGPIIGVLAAQASARGAWIAPANVPLRDVIALTPAIDPASWLALQQSLVNLLRNDPRGFLVLSAATLSDEPGFESINVRRLLTLLRRLALRRGTSYVFEPNSDVLRRAISRGFTTLLSELFRRGAFAGTTPADSFAVVTGNRIATDADSDAGRLIVELRVAPALPLQFLTLRLVQSGDGLTATEGA
jgi:hypothetical protein